MKILSMLASLLVLLTLYSCKEEVLGTKPTFTLSNRFGLVSEVILLLI
jgi:hypothetical protein